MFVFPASTESEIPFSHSPLSESSIRFQDTALPFYIYTLLVCIMLMKLLNYKQNRYGWPHYVESKSNGSH